MTLSPELAAELRARAEQILTRIKAAKLANPNPSPVVRTSKPTGSGDGFIDTLNDIANKQETNHVNSK